MNSKYKSLLSNTGIFAIGNILIKLISFFLLPLYTSVLTQSQYGIAELLNNTIELVLPVATMCIIEALYRFSIDDGVNRESLFIHALVIVLVGDMAVFLVALLLKYLLDYKYAFHFFALYVATSFYKTTIQFARGLGHNKRYVFYGLINTLLLVGLNMLLLVKYKGGVEEYLLSFTIAYGIAGAFSFFLSKQYIYLHFSGFDIRLLKEMLAYSIPCIPNMLSWWINSLSDRYFILFLWGSNIAGLYTAASKLPAMINMITAIFQQAWQYSTAKEINDKDSKSFFSNVFRGYVYICVLACAGLIIANRLICKILIRGDFGDSWRYVPLLLLAATFGCIGTYFGTFYNALKNNIMLMYSTLMGAMVNLLLNIILIPGYGGMGAAVATVVSYFVVLSVRFVDINRHVELEIDKSKLFIQLIALLFVTIVGCVQKIELYTFSVLLFVIIALTEKEVVKNIFIILILKKKG